MRSLDRKLLRELWRLKGQMFSIAVVVATGIMSVVTMRGGYDALLDAQERYYRETRFADVWAPVERAPNRMADEIARLPGVAAVDTRVTGLATLDLPGLSVPGAGRFVSIPTTGRPQLNDIHLIEGRYPERGAPEETLVSQNFAAARALTPGDSVRAVLNGRRRNLRVVGIATSPEHSYSVPPGSLYPDDERYGVFWMGREALAAAWDLEGAFNEAVVTLAPGTDPEAVVTRLDRLLDRYGARGAYPRSDQVSHEILQSELDQNRIMSTVIPAVFLGVAAFLLNLVMGRMISAQRTEIAVLKAFGYRDREVGLHYLMYAMTAVAVGAAVGAAGGAWLGAQYVDLYGEYFAFPDLEYRLGPGLLAIAAGVSAIAAGAGAWRAVRGAVELPPAEAMRPEPPPRFEPGPLERSGLGRRLPSAGRMILRSVERRPMRSLLSSVGVAFSVAILVLGLFMFDGVSFMMNLQFQVVQREDLTLTFQRPLDASVLHSLRNLDGVTRVETFRTVPARLTAGHREREVGLQGIDPDSRLRRIASADGTLHPVPSTGVVLSAILADGLRVGTGDTLAVELLDGRRATGRIVVAGVVEDFMGVSAIMSRPALAHLAGGSATVSGAWLAVMETERGALDTRLKNMPSVASVASPGRLLETFESQLQESLFVAIGFLLGFAGVISVGIIYVGSRIALSERGRELASLRVMGFRRGEVSALLLGEQALVTLVAIPMGWLLGYGLASLVVGAIQSDVYRIPMVITSRTYALSAAITLAAAVGSGWIVRRRVNHLDLIEVLKTRE